MNANTRAPNNTALNTVSSFVTGNVTNVKNAAANVANTVTNSMKNMFNTASNATADITEPIAESLNAAIENNSSPLVSIPLIIALGALIVLFIIVVMFREQIATGLEVLWMKIKDLLGLSKPAVTAPPPEFVPETQFFDQGAVEKILPGKKEVFNVATDKYTYTDAEPLCKAFGAELATYDQVKEAWQKGADWCNYGWVKGQAAVYPTQQVTYDKLQAGPESQRMSCGVPGVNGGYFDNPELRFGVNCYGTKPGENEADTRAIMANNGNLTPEALEYDRKVQEYKTQMGQIPVNPFKPGTWAS
jgi:hypothetical protein